MLQSLDMLPTYSFLFSRRQFVIAFGLELTLSFDSQALNPLAHAAPTVLRFYWCEVRPDKRRQFIKVLDVPVLAAGHVSDLPAPCISIIFSGCILYPDLDDEGM